FTDAFSFFLYVAAYHSHLHSFPTRRSSDLAGSFWCAGRLRQETIPAPASANILPGNDVPPPRRGHSRAGRRSRAGSARSGRAGRSEEHTSELQSRVDLVCRLLLEKKKRNV